MAWLMDVHDRLLERGSIGFERSARKHVAAFNSSFCAQRRRG